MQIIVAPDSRLNQISKNVDIIDDSIISTLDQMLECMYQNNGIGLAAPQVGICLLYTSPSPRDISGSRMPSSA